MNLPNFALDSIVLSCASSNLESLSLWQFFPLKTSNPWKEVGIFEPEYSEYLAMGISGKSIDLIDNGHYLMNTGLLPLLKSIQKPCNLRKFTGLTVGVDAYGWLHRGTVACAMDLALGKPTTK